MKVVQSGLRLTQKRYRTFEIRDQSKTNKFDNKTTTYLINKVFSKWGYSTIKAGNKSGKRINGKMVYNTPYNIQNENEIYNINVYEFIKPKVVQKTEKKVSTVREGDLPM